MPQSATGLSVRWNRHRMGSPGTRAPCRHARGTATREGAESLRPHPVLRPALRGAPGGWCRRLCPSGGRCRGRSVHGPRRGWGSRSRSPCDERCVSALGVRRTHARPCSTVPLSPPAPFAVRHAGLRGEHPSRADNGTCGETRGDAGASRPSWPPTSVSATGHGRERPLAGTPSRLQVQWVETGADGTPCHQRVPPPCGPSGRRHASVDRQAWGLGSHRAGA